MKDETPVMPIPVSDRYVHRKDRESYSLRVVAGDPHGRTHKLHNAEHYWEGTKEEVEKEFERA
jgi:hypothetical protein